MLDLFWEAVDQYIEQVYACMTVADVMDLTNDLFAAEKQFSGSGQAFFPGSGGDKQLYWALNDTWARRPLEGDIYFVATDKNGDSFTYVEGDLYLGDVSHAAAG